MLARLLIILSLVWQPAALAAPAPTRADAPASCVAVSCCALSAPRSQPTCCPQQAPAQAECVRCKGPCRCGITPTDPPQKPISPLPAAPTQLILTHALPAITPIAIATGAETSLRIGNTHAPPRASPPLLCIWLN